MRGWALLVCLAGAAWGQQVDPDTQAAKRHFDRGRILYEEGRYEEAIREFEDARKLKRLPELLYNIARTHERREDWGAAAAAYEKYLQEQPDSADAVELRQRISVLRSRLPPPPTPTATAPRRYRRAAIGVLVGTLVLAGLGGVLVGTVPSDFQNLQRTCELRQCGPSDWASVEARANAGYAMFALAGAAAVADVALWVLDHRQGDRVAAVGVRVTF